MHMLESLEPTHQTKPLDELSLWTNIDVSCIIVSYSCYNISNLVANIINYWSCHQNGKVYGMFNAHGHVTLNVPIPFTIWGL